MSPKKCPRKVTQKEDISWTFLSTRCRQKCPRDVTPFVHEMSPIMSTRCLPPFQNGQKTNLIIKMVTRRNLVKTHLCSPSSIPVLLTVGFLTHSFDSRFSVDFLPPRDYRLKVTNVGWHDAGIYLCQLAVHPPSLIWARLDIEPPIVHILDSEEAPVWELHYDVGTTVEMVCRVKRPPLQGMYIVY